MRTQPEPTGSAGSHQPERLCAANQVLPAPDRDYDVACVTPFNLKQNQPVAKRERFSQIRHGSQVDLIVPLSSRFDFDKVAEIGDHVKAGIDPIIKVTEKMELR